MQVHDPLLYGRLDAIEKGRADRQKVKIVLCVIAAIIFYSAGSTMGKIESISGDSIAEAFYQAMGTFSYAMALLSLGIAAS